MSAAVSFAADELFDVLVVGAGLSGIDAACRLQQQCPQHRYAIVEARERLGGTWDLFRYPGIRSDSDMFTLGFPFRPWRGDQAIAGGPEILQYLRETAAEHGIDRHIRFGHRVVAASWSGEAAQWTLTIERSGEAAPLSLRCRFLFLCSGYYDYAQGYLPEYPGRAAFAGPVIQPQHWPVDLDCRGRRVVIIGSGATAVTLAPALAARGAAVTLLQRSPTYVVALPARDALAAWAMRWLPRGVGHRLVRWKNLLAGLALYHWCRASPRRARALLLAGVRRDLPQGYDIATHFTPHYDPWQQRLCVVPDADLFRAIGDGKVTMVTDHIDRFTATGIRLRSGAELAADLIVSATGLQLKSLGGIAVSVDGRRIEPGELITYKGAMYRGVPNLAASFGYTNASWTLRADLTSRWVCRVLQHMQRRGARVCVPQADAGTMVTKPWVDFTSGYFQRAIDRMPKQGMHRPWRLSQNYIEDLLALRFGRIDDGRLHFG